MNEQRNEHSQKFHVDGPTLQIIRDVAIYIQRFKKGALTIKMQLFMDINEVLPPRKCMLAVSEAVVYVEAYVLVNCLQDFKYNEVYDNKGKVPLLFLPVNTQDNIHYI